MYHSFRSSATPTSTVQHCWRERELIRIGPLVSKVHRAGERTLLEYLIELVGNDPVLAVDAEELLHRYSRLDRDILEALDAVEIRPPLAIVDGGQR